jgi:hypothetical protein
VKKVEDFFDLIDAIENFLVDFSNVVNYKDRLVLVSRKTEE